MWYIIPLDDPDGRHVLLCGKAYVVGRKDCDIIITADATVSRKHAELLLSHSEANLGAISRLPILRLKDLSKFGTWVNKEKMVGEKLLKDGDTIMFGSPKSTYTVVYEPLVVTTSCLATPAKKVLRTQLSILGGHVISEWRTDCSLLIMSKISVTIKVICALLSQKRVVMPTYLEAYVQFLQGTKDKPDPSVYMPDIAETQLDSSEVSFAPNEKRKALFQGMTFIFLAQKQFTKMSLAIELGGGTPLLLDEDPGDDAMLVGPGTVVMACTDTSLTPQGERWVTHVQQVLDRRGKHMIQDAELGYAVLYCSTERHCNPDFVNDQSISRLPSQSLSQADIPYVSDTPSRSQVSKRSQHPTSPTPSSRPAGKPEVPSTSKRKTRSPSPDSGKKALKFRSPSPVPGKKAEKSRSPSPVPGKKAEKSRSPSPVPGKKAEKSRSPSPVPGKKAQKTRSPSPVPRRGRSRSPAEQHRESQVDKSPLVPVVAVKSPLVPVAAVKSEPISQTNPPSQRKRARNIIDDDDSDDETERPVMNKRVKAELATPQSKVSTSTSAAAPAHTDTFWDSDDDIDYSKIETGTSPSRSPKPLSRVSPSRRSKSRSPSPRPSKTATKSKIKTEAVRDPATEKSVVSGTSRANEETIYVRGQRSNKREVVDDEYQQSVVPVEDVEDRKSSALSANVPSGFLSTRKPIQDQVQRNRDYEPESELPSGCVNVDVVSLVARQPRVVATASRDCPDGHTRWKGKVVKNFKKFRKTNHYGSQALPTIIGGSDLEVHTGQRSKEMDVWFREVEQAESQATSEEKRAQELFDWDPSTRRRGR